MYEQEAQQAEPETAEPTAEDTTAGAQDTGDSEVAAAVDEQAQASSGAAAEAAPEVPDDASQTIARAQEHIDNLDMDEERAAAKRAM